MRCDRRLTIVCHVALSIIRSTLIFSTKDFRAPHPLHHTLVSRVRLTGPFSTLPCSLAAQSLVRRRPVLSIHGTRGAQPRALCHRRHRFLPRLPRLLFQLRPARVVWLRVAVVGPRGTSLPQTSPRPRGGA